MLGRREVYGEDMDYTCWSLAGSAVSLKGSFFVGSATGGARVNCSGSEKGLLNCSHSNSSCGSSELAGVACPGMLVIVP